MLKIIAEKEVTHEELTRGLFKLADEYIRFRPDGCDDGTQQSNLISSLTTALAIQITVFIDLTHKDAPPQKKEEYRIRCVTIAQSVLEKITKSIIQKIT